MLGKEFGKIQQRKNIFCDSYSVQGHRTFSIFPVQKNTLKMKFLLSLLVSPLTMYKLRETEYEYEYEDEKLIISERIKPRMQAVR